MNIVISAFFLSLFFIANCSNTTSSPKPSGSASIIGRYAAHYDAKTGKVNYNLLSANQNDPRSQSLRARGLLDYGDSTGLTGSTTDEYGCAIRDYSKNINDINACMALVDPDSCTTDYNETTKTLSFYAKLVNKSNIAEDPTTFHYTDPTNYGPNTTFFAPFYFKITGLEWDDITYPQLITAVNTNISTAECGSNGLTLTNDDQDNNDKFDCIYPDQAYSSADDPVDPGWDFTPFISNGDMTPGEDTGCVLFMQYTLTQNQSFVLYFDVLAAKSDGTPPSQPTITSHTDNSYVNTSPITVSGASCVAGATVYVEGGSEGTPPSTTCTGGSTYSINVDLKLNQVNTLSVYQVSAGEQSQPRLLTITHDNVAPTVSSWSPANGETVVGVNSRCVATFSEPMDTATFQGGSNTNNNSCNSGNFVMCRQTNNRRMAGTISFSNDGTQAVYTLSAPLAASTNYTCNAKTGTSAPTTLRDLAGNALSPTSTITFTSGTTTQDQTAPYVTSIFPADNSTISTNTSFYVYFNEPVRASSLTDTNCSNNADIPNIAVWQTNACVTAGYPTPRPNPVTGTISLNADGDIATFTPSSALEPDDCLSITVSSCVTDLAGNALPNRGNFNVGAYGGSNLQYNSWNVFYTKPTADNTSPSFVHSGPMLNATDVKLQIFPFVIFDEPIDASTVIGDYIYLTIFGDTAKIPLTLRQDPTLQVVTLRPSGSVQSSTTHVVTVTGAVSDTSGNLMASPQTTSFVKGATTDNTAPTVLSVTPTDGSTVSRCSVVDIHFSEPMDTSTLHGANIRLIRVASSLNTAKSLQVSDNGMHVRLIPEASLQGSSCGTGNNNCRYTPTISGVKDRAGNTIAATYNSTTFLASTDGTAPTVSSFAPGDGSTVAQNGSMAIFFSEPMDRSTITNGNFTFGSACPTGFVGVFPAEDGRWAVINCYNNMSSGSGNTLTVSGSNVRDRYINANTANCESGAGNTIGSNPFITFTVSGTSDTTAPTVSAVSPTDGQTSVSSSATPTITFSEAIDPRTVTPSTVMLMSREGELVNATLSLNSTATAVTITPVSSLPNGIYYIVATTALRDLGGANPYDGAGGENSPVAGVLRTCFSTTASACP